MRAETVINTLLTGSTSLTALVGTRIYLDTRPEADPLPALVYNLISDRQDNARQGEKETVTARVQVNSFSRTAEEAIAVREQVRLACHLKAGSLGGIQVVACLEDSSGGDSYDHMVDIYNKPMDFIIHYLR